MPQKIIAHAAEAIILKDDGRIIKRRIAKGYRISEIDEKFRQRRTKSEAKLLEKARGLINVPRVLKVDEKNKEIIMDFISGLKLSENLDRLDNKFEVAEQIGREIAKLHDADIIHGDLTTSNMILVENKLNNVAINNSNKHNNKEELNINNKKEIKNLIVNKLSKDNCGIVEQEETMEQTNFKVFFIDFGLGFHSSRIEDKAVDLHLMRQALEAKHFSIWQECFDIILRNYKSKDKEKILEQLEKVEKRGRYKH